MTSSANDSRQALANLILAVLAGDDLALMDVTLGARRVRLEVSAAVRQLRPGEWQEFSQEEADVVKALAGQGWVVTGELARQVCAEVTTEFRAMLRNLAKRGVVETGKAGVRLVESEGGAP